MPFSDNEIVNCQIQTGMLTIMNLGLQNVELQKDAWVARVAVSKDVENAPLAVNVQRVIDSYPERFGKNSELLSNIDVEMHLELTSTMPITY